MNDAELERELARLTPAPLPKAVLSRLLAERPAVRKIARFPRWLPLAAAAAFVAGWLLLRPAPPTPHRALETFHPVETDQYLISARDLGVVEVHPGQPYRLVHCVWADRESFRGPHGAAPLELRQTREQIVPVALQIH